MEPARLTVGELLTRPVRRVNRHTPKKAVMVIYRRAGYGRTAVDTRATITRQGARYSRKRMAANDVVSVVYLIHTYTAVAQCVQPLAACEEPGINRGILWWKIS